MTKKKIFLLLVTVIAGVLFLQRTELPTISAVNENQTIPTAPPPTSPPPTATQSSGGGNPTATFTPDSTTPQASPTSTLLPASFAPTPVGGFLETAVPCGANPTIQTLGATNVRSGPGTAYDVIGGLVYLEVRFIVGRAESAEWWLIQFNNGQLGWVADEIVVVQGYTPIVPIVAAPPLANGTATPGSIWNPTAIPFCTVTPNPTDTPTSTPGAVQNSGTPTTTPAPTQPAPTEVRPTETPIVQSTAVPLSPTAAIETAVPATPDENSSSTGIILLGLGLLLVIGVAIFFLRKRE